MLNYCFFLNRGSVNEKFNKSNRQKLGKNVIQNVKRGMELSDKFYELFLHTIDYLKLTLNNIKEDN